MVDDGVVSESEWDLVLVLENLKCELNGIKTYFWFGLFPVEVVLKSFPPW